MSSIGSEDKILVTWKDNKAVTIASNIHGMQPVTTANRWSRQEKKHVNINIPSAVKIYNHTMGGVDLHDQFVANYRVRIRSKKWWWPHFNWVVNSSAVNE